MSTLHNQPLFESYYLGLMYGWQSYHPKHWSNNPYLALPACRHNQHTNKQWAVINYSLYRIIFRRSAEQLLTATLGLKRPFSSEMGLIVSAGSRGACWQLLTNYFHTKNDLWRKHAEEFSAMSRLCESCLWNRGPPSKTWPHGLEDD